MPEETQSGFDINQTFTDSTQAYTEGAKIVTDFDVSKNETTVYTGSDNMRFPSTLGSTSNNTPAIMFIAKKWEKPSVNKGTTTSKRFRQIQKGSVALYLPSFSETTSVIWDETQTLATAGANFIYDQIASALPGTKMFKDNLKISNGISISQDTIATFQDIENRQFTFSFELMPMSRDDTNNIERIIRFFRLNSSPNFKEAIISFPCIFDVKIMGVRDNYFTFLPMALTGMSVSYGDGQNQAMVLMSNDTPSMVKLDLTFREVRKPYRDSFE